MQVFFAGDQGAGSPGGGTSAAGPAAAPAAAWRGDRRVRGGDGGTGVSPPGASYFSHAGKVTKSALRGTARRALAPPAAGHSPYPRSP